MAIFSVITPTLLWPGIFLIEEPSGRDHEVAHLPVFGVDAEDGDVFFLAVADGNAVGERSNGEEATIPGTTAGQRGGRRW